MNLNKMIRIKDSNRGIRWELLWEEEAGGHTPYSDALFDILNWLNDRGELDFDPIEEYEQLFNENFDKIARSHNVEPSRRMSPELEDKFWIKANIRTLQELLPADTDDELADLIEDYISNRKMSGRRGYEDQIAALEELVDSKPQQIDMSSDPNDRYDFGSWTRINK